MNISNNKKVRMANNRGITLIALVVTIIVLIILATISINAVLRENGIIKKAEKARKLHEQGIITEEEAMNTLLAEYENATSGNGEEAGDLPEITPTTAAGTQVKKPSTWDSTKVIAISDGSGKEVPLPNGFCYVGGSRTEGLVISDNGNDANKGTGYDIASTLEGNQFVWIPATGEDLARTKFDSNGQPTNSIVTNYTEPYDSGYSDELSDYNEMHDQVVKYGGFYIRKI